MTKLLVFAVAALACGAAQAAGLDKDTNAWWGHIKVLASDEFQGRLTGSPGYRKAADYVARGFERAGLKPAGSAGYLQNVAFEVQTIQSERSHASLIGSGGVAPIDLSNDFVPSTTVQQPLDTRAPLLFAGYGIHLPDAGYDDFAGLNIHGAVVVVLIGGPKALSGAQRAFAFAEALPHFLEESGAAGLLYMTTPDDREMPWQRQKAAGSQPGMLLAEKKLRRFQGPMFYAAFNEAKADLLLAHSGHGFKELVALAEAHQVLPHFRLAAELAAHVETTHADIAADNVVGELPGSDPALAAQAVVLSAHLDHLGTGKPDHGDGIFHGAMDNAAGVATLLEIAQALHAAKAKPRRSLVFLTVCAEEKGLLGSRYFAAHPSSHAGQIVADINIDEFLPLYPLKLLVGYGAEESSLGDDIRAAGKRAGLELVADPQPDHLIFVRSDQYAFVRKGTPAVMIDMAPHPGTAEEAAYKEWVSTRYHAQADDLSQPIDLAAADAFNRFVYGFALRVADAPKAPEWHADSFFRRFTTHPLP